MNFERGVGWHALRSSEGRDEAPIALSYSQPLRLEYPADPTGQGSAEELIVDVNRAIYFWVTSIGVLPNSDFRYLRGLTFDETDTGVGGRNVGLLESPLRRVSEYGVEPFEATLGLVHLGQHGYVLSVNAGSIGDVPFLLTNDRSISLAYSGPIVPEADEEGFDLPAAMGDGMPIVGVDWLGVATYASGRYHLIAFSSKRWEKVGVRDAYCPWWATCLEQNVAIFRFSSPSE